MQLHKLIKKERERQGITRYRMAKTLNTSQGYYTKLEDGEHSPSFDKIIKICSALNASITIHPNETVTLKEKK